MVLVGIPGRMGARSPASSAVTSTGRICDLSRLARRVNRGNRTGNPRSPRCGGQSPQGDRPGARKLAVALERRLSANIRTHTPLIAKGLSGTTCSSVT
eukprot:10361313-Heterocapsa_arctica.AAC.1